ncbi:hypothetical protein PtA15_12A28 [Puccinia triticina]|uniref:Uncharacterized protein n=1 Tax=Puccinia triticina TaxID=208348 RepID=A0ABY7D0C2_9BASI|nr:uncharacterized protein PtA15_12A28 [Puccinia triticina]WAQ90043.1 hypothetical protein PtA15_12A28 [Puccinia triticina]
MNDPKYAAEYHKNAVEDPQEVLEDSPGVGAEKWQKMQAEHEARKIPLEFKHMMERPGTTVAQVEQWIRTLYSAISLAEQRNQLKTPHMAASALYGLYSLILRYPEDEELLHKFELLNPSAGFSPEIANLDEFRAIFEKDPQISKAVSIHREEREEPLKALAANFSSSSSHKRVVTLAVFNNVLTQYPTDQLYRTQFQRIFSQPTLFPHEQELIKHVPYHT